MAKKLDADRIEQARQKGQTADRREEEKRRIQETIAKNRSGKRKSCIILQAPLRADDHTWVR